MKDFPSSWVDFQKDDAHCRRERKKARDLQKSAWWKAKLRAGICHYCGKKFPPDQLTMDHVIPVARGGTSTPGNIVPACRACNKTKSCLTPVEQILDRLEQQDREKNDSP
ncbi:MAG: HNH endonuclease [Kiritimatiellia bacterium]